MQSRLSCDNSSNNNGELKLISKGDIPVVDHQGLHRIKVAGDLEAAKQTVTLMEIRHTISRGAIEVRVHLQLLIFLHRFHIHRHSPVLMSPVHQLEA